jgi:phage RecT family recombinase
VASDISVIVNTVTHREMQEVIRKTLPSSVSQERFTQAVVAAIKHRPEVFLECDRNSVYNAVVEAARDGLVPDGRQGALVPFRPKGGGAARCQFLIMPEGIIDKLAASGITCYAASVYEGERFRLWNDDTGQHVEHEPGVFGARGLRIGAFACARTKNGATYVEAMNMDDIARVMAKSNSKGKNGGLVGPWVDWPERMEQKSCLHRVAKRVPDAVIPDDEEFRDESPTTITVAPEPAPSAPPPPSPTKKPGRAASLQRVVDAESAPPPAAQPATPAAAARPDDEPEYTESEGPF